MNQLKFSYDYCERMIGINGLVIYKIFKDFPEDSRKALSAVLAFCNRLNLIVLESNNPKKELLKFEHELEQFHNGTLPQDPMWIALEDVFEKYDLEIQPFRNLISGQKQDLIKNRILSVNELLDYCYDTVGSMGLMLLPILAPEKKYVLKEEALKLSLAIQLSNILRDIGEDFMKGKIYLPKELFIKHQYSFKEFVEGEINSSFINLWEEIALIAESYYEEGLRSIHEFPTYSRNLVKGTVYLNRAILDEIRNNGYQVFKKQNYVTNEVKDRVKSIL
ncbi:phytoene/squalene synthase family protein [Cytobacillus sp. FJAT-54145]|uniref:Phytoene/squalene synthase family protein n=1 Tax=Cytobacillus spartinae TaxID=3299023 RepID=A0ABW6KAN9_9BACI